jgi:hypothetical protein
MDPNHQVFLVAEFGALRREIELEFKEPGDFLRYAVVSSGAMWAWFMSHTEQPISKRLCFLPLVLSTLLWGETIAIRRKIRQIGRYIEKIETVFRLPKGFGWETSSLAVSGSTITSQRGRV